MATIHSLPTELIRHILLLAYPPSRWPWPYESTRGLAQTALVHSSWTEPSLSVMMERMVLTQSSAAKFAASGPVGWSCKELCFHECPSGELRGVLAKAKAGGIRSLSITLTEEKLDQRVFSYASLKALESVEIVTREYECDHSYWRWSCERPECDPWDESPHPRYDLVLTHGPARLKIATLDAHNIPEALFLPSAKTLADLTRSLNSSNHFKQLRLITNQFTSLHTLRVPRLWWDGKPFALPSPFVAFVAGLPSLATLDLVDVSPQQLERLLKALKPGQPLHTLKTTVPTIFDSNRDQVDYDQWVTKWVPSLRRCAGLLAGLGWKRWELKVVTKEGKRDLLEYETTAEEYESWDQGKEGWREFTEEVKKAGVELELVAWDLEDLK